MANGERLSAALWTSISSKHFWRSHGSAASRERPSAAFAPSRRSRRRFAPWRKKSGPSCSTAAAGGGAVPGRGKVFQKYAEDVLEQRRVMLVALAEMHRVPRGELVVSANEGTCLHILPEVFAEFKRQYPSVAVSVKRLEHNKILEAIIENSCDFGVVSMPVPDKRLTVVQIHRDELIVITPPRHPLAAQKKATVAEVVEYPLLLPKVGRTRDALETLFHERGLKPRISMELDSSELLKRFVAADVGVGFIPRSHVAEDLQANALAALTLADASIQRA